VAWGGTALTVAQFHHMSRMISSNHLDPPERQFAAVEIAFSAGRDQPFTDTHCAEMIASKQPFA